MTTLTAKKEYVLPDVSRLKFTEKDHYYELDGKKLTGVTTVIDGTSSKQNLIQWAANMAVDYVKEKGHLVENPIEDNGELINGAFYKIYAGHLEEARTAYARKRDKAATKGTDTHALVEEYILECLSPGRDGVPMTGHKDPAIRPFVDWAVSNVDRFLAAEQRLYSETHAFAGTCDFVALIDGKLTIGDLKTFPKMWSADAFIQMGAYSIAWEELTGERPAQSVVVKMCDPNDERIKKYGGKPFSVYPRYALAEDEEMFLTRLKMYRYNQNFVSPKE